MVSTLSQARKTGSSRETTGTKTGVNVQIYFDVSEKWENIAEFSPFGQCKWELNIFFAKRGNEIASL